MAAVPHLGFYDRRDVVGAPTIVVTSSNLLVNNPDLRAAAGELMASDADILVLQEVDSAGLKILDSVLHDDAYPFRAADPHPGFHGGVIYSRWPLLGWRTLDIAGSPMLEAEVLTPTGAITVVNVHTVAPLTPRLAAQWRRQFDALEMLAADVETPLLLIGDFNATTNHEPFRRLTSAELRDAFLDVGSGLGTTFPSNHHLLPPLIRIDHAVGGASLQFHNIDDWRVDGSDHRAITISVSLSRQELKL
jgi:endonuclease/exonuclease/phosphatase (EEP) superfamily protein YafD